MQISHHRNGLTRTLRAIAGGEVTLGFIGGSITDGRVPYNWPEPVAAWFVERFPGVRVRVENAAIGATGSELAVFRAQRDLIDRGCDLVFVEYAVNDSGEPTAKRQRTREGLLRKLLAGEGRDLVLAYTFSQDMYAEMTTGQAPASISEFEALGEHYRLGSVWMGLHALREVLAGGMRWEEWLPDGIHPQYRGSYSYAQSVTAYLERELITAPNPAPMPTGDARPAPLDAANWESAFSLPFSAVTLHGPWTLRRWLQYPWIDQVLDTAAPGARLSFTFNGRALVLGLDFGKTSGEFRYALDGGEWVDVVRERYDWVGDSGWYRVTTIAEELAPGEHRMEIETTRDNRPNCTGTNFRLGLIGVVE